MLNVTPLLSSMALQIGRCAGVDDFERYDGGFNLQVIVRD